MQSSRTILAVVLSLAVLIAYYTWFAPPASKPPSSQPRQGAPPWNGPLGLGPTKPGQPVEPAEPGQLVPDPMGSPPAKTAPLREIIFENDQIKAVFSTKGGVLKHWVLKNFHTGASVSSPLIDLLNHEGEGDAFQLSLEGGTVPSMPIYTIESEKERELTLSWRSQEIEIRKKVVLLHSEVNPYILDYTLEIVNRGAEPVELEPRLWLGRRQKPIKSNGGFFSFLKGPLDLYMPALFVDGKLKVETNWDKLPAKKEEIGKIYWSGLTDRYFLMGFIAREGTDGISVVYGKSADGEVASSLSYGQVTLNPGEKLQKRFSAYLGPKKREELKPLGVNLEKSVDYGWVCFLALSILWLMIFFHKIIPNWGVAIIVLTFFIKLLLHPVNKKAMQSMKAMQKLQPRLQELRTKYKDSKEKLNMEMMLLFKTHKVNPMGGCLPMLIQMPVYIALYKVLYNAIELYHAPFFWFYRDLSAPDPYLITPILLGILMALQQKLTPVASMDPAQQKMMMIMPLMFSAFMIFLPSGLVIYIMVNTIMSVIQQYMIHREMSFWDLLKKVRSKS